MSKDVLSRLLGIRIRPEWSAAIRAIAAGIVLFLSVNAMGNWLGYWRGNYASSEAAWNFINASSNTPLVQNGAVAQRCLSHWIVMLPAHWMLMSLFATLQWRYQKRRRRRRSTIKDVPLPFDMPGWHPGRDLDYLPKFMAAFLTSSCAAVACTLHSTLTFLANLNSISTISLPQTLDSPVSADFDSMRESASILTSLFASCTGFFLGLVVCRAISAKGLRKELAGVAIVTALQISILFLSFSLPNSDPMSCVVFVVFHAIAQFASLILLIFLFQGITD